MKPRNSKLSHVFGPVMSRRLGKSLGIDMLNAKICTLDCVYCECGKTKHQTTLRQVFVEPEIIIKELQERLPQIAEDVDFLTFSGSGEPTLSLTIRTLTEFLKRTSKKPIALLTNGTLLYRKDVLDDIREIDVVIPSLDAADVATFNKINRPHPDLDFHRYLDGLLHLHDEFPGRILLEILICHGINDNPEHIRNLSKIVKKIRPDSIQLNTAIRPGTESFAVAVDCDRLDAIGKALDYPYRVFSERLDAQCSQGLETSIVDDEEAIIQVIHRRPSSITDLSAGLKIDPSRIKSMIQRLEQSGTIISRKINDIVYYFTSRETK